MTWYISVLNNSIGLFQYYFWQLVMIFPQIFLISSAIILFYLMFKKK